MRETHLSQNISRYSTIERVISRGGLAKKSLIGTAGTEFERILRDSEPIIRIGRSRSNRYSCALPDSGSRRARSLCSNRASNRPVCHKVARVRRATTREQERRLVVTRQAANRYDDVGLADDQ